MEKIWVLSVTDKLAGTSAISVFEEFPDPLEVMDFMSDFEEYLNYKEIREAMSTLRCEGSFSSGYRFYELNDTKIL